MSAAIYNRPYARLILCSLWVEQSEFLTEAFSPTDGPQCEHVGCERGECKELEEEYEEYDDDECEECGGINRPPSQYRAQSEASGVDSFGNFSPVNQINQHLCSFHHYADDMRRQVRVEVVRSEEWSESFM